MTEEIRNDEMEMETVEGTTGFGSKKLLVGAGALALAGGIFVGNKLRKKLRAKKALKRQEEFEPRYDEPETVDYEEVIDD